MEMRTERYRITKAACFLTSASMAIPAVLSPLLFTTFHEKYGISYSLLGFLVVLNFATQLFMDLIYSFFQDKLNLRRSVKLTPFVITVGLLLYAAAPVVFPGSPYMGLALGTIIFSAGGGLSEVLTSPVIAKLPSKHPERTLSRLHSCYAWGGHCIQNMEKELTGFFCSGLWEQPHVMPLRRFRIRLPQGWQPVR